MAENVPTSLPELSEPCKPSIKKRCKQHVRGLKCGKYSRLLASDKYLKIISKVVPWKISMG